MAEVTKKGIATGKALVLRTCRPDMSSSCGFVWPEAGPVEAPDWNPNPTPGGGLHGLLWGVGEPIWLSPDSFAKWLVVEVEAADIVDLNGKCKFPRGVVRYCGTRLGATSYIREHGGKSHPICCGIFAVGQRDTATAGTAGILAAGNEGKAVAGDYGTCAAGHSGFARVGHEGVAAAGPESAVEVGGGAVAAVGTEGRATGKDASVIAGGECSALEVGDNGVCANLGGGKVVAGEAGIAVSGPYGSAIAGAGGIAISCTCGVARSGAYGTSIVGLHGRASAGEHGVIVICESTGHYGARSLVVGRVGHDGILPGVLYCLKNGKLIRADEGAEVPQDALG